MREVIYILRLYYNVLQMEIICDGFMYTTLQITCIRQNIEYYLV